MILSAIKGKKIKNYFRINPSNSGINAFYNASLNNLHNTSSLYEPINTAKNNSYSADIIIIKYMIHVITLI